MDASSTLELIGSKIQWRPTADYFRTFTIK